MAHHPGYYLESACDLEDFKALISQSLDPTSLRFAAKVEKNVPIYDCAALRPLLIDPDRRRDVMAEWAGVLLTGSGALALAGAYADTGVIDEATALYNQIIADEKASKGAAEDHFAKAGANDRIWNSLQKLCEASPDVFARYFANEPIAAVCEAWLGPNYQMTAQVNQVRPGGAAQQAHRDYHLGFQTAEVSGTYPRHVHDLSPLMTLQGAVAHSDMPIDSGPTKLLPFSQAYKPGYAAWRRDDFRACFEDNYIQLPLAKGDALFFNPALFHAAGANVTRDHDRMANLIQVSSAFGIAMETIDRQKMSSLLYPALQARLADGSLTRAEVQAAIAACAFGYSFPTNLDSDPPRGGLAPETQAALFLRALDSGWSPQHFDTELQALATRQRA